MSFSDQEQLLSCCPTCYKKSKLRWNTVSNAGYCTVCGKMRRSHDRQEMGDILIEEKRAKPRARKSDTNQKTVKSRSVSQEDSPAVKLAKHPTGGVYLLKMGTDYKIGKASDFDRRFRELQIQLPRPVERIHRIYTDDPRGIEIYWHKRFAAKRLHGEWFALTDEDVAIFIARDKM